MSFHRSLTYNSWRAMKERCLNPNHIWFGIYGGRGIKIYTRWYKFKNFLKDMGERPEKTTLDRIDKEKNYCPSNCKWATVKEQNNNKGNNRTFIYNGMEKTIAEWAEWAGLTYHTLWFRIKNNYSLGKALEK